MGTVSFNKLREGDVGYIITDRAEYFSACFDYTVNGQPVTPIELMQWFNKGNHSFTRPVQVLSIGRRYIVFLGAVIDMTGKYIPVTFCMPTESYLSSCILDEIENTAGVEEHVWRPSLHFYRCENISANERNQKQFYVYLNKTIPMVCGYLFEDSDFVYVTEKQISPSVRMNGIPVLSSFPYAKIPRDTYYACAVPISTGDTREEPCIFDAVRIDAAEIALVQACKKVNLYTEFTDSAPMLRGTAAKQFKADLMKVLEMKVREVRRAKGILYHRPLYKTMREKCLAELTQEEIEYLKEVLCSVCIS